MRDKETNPSRAAVVAGLLLAAVALPAAQRSGTEDVKNIEQRVSAFLTAFDNLDWRAFRSFWDAQATVFHPDASHQKRIETPGEFDRAWQEVFDQIKKDSHRSAPPYVNLQPADLRVTLLSQDVALVTFHLESEERFGRRTLVWKRTADGWKLVHLHASNFSSR